MKKKEGKLGATSCGFRKGSCYFLTFPQQEKEECSNTGTVAVVPFQASRIVEGLAPQREKKKEIRSLAVLFIGVAD